MFHRKCSWRRYSAFTGSVTAAVTWYSMSYPIKLYHISSTETTTKPPIHRNIDFPLLFALQLQLDCTISFINQLLKEFQTLLINMEHLAVEYSQIQSAYKDIDSANNNNEEEIGELLLEVRSQWSILTQKLDNAEIFTSLVEKRKEIFQLWTSQTAEHIKHFGKS
ncbi:unnamed protein product [Trichobilharzia regenti]|nr:unnamed protein product [Trichobilharzia regenti]